MENAGKMPALLDAVSYKGIVSRMLTDVKAVWGEGGGRFGCVSRCGGGVRLYFGGRREWNDARHWASWVVVVVSWVA